MLAEGFQKNVAPKLKLTNWNKWKNWFLFINAKTCWLLKLLLYPRLLQLRLHQLPLCSWTRQCQFSYNCQLTIDSESFQAYVFNKSLKGMAKVC